jgi:polyisoprenoid-binding protein YceI
VDTAASYIYWHCDSHHGSVPLKEGVVTMQGDRLLDGTFVILMDSIHDEDIDYELMRKTLNNTLRSEFFFDVKNFPLAEFQVYDAEKKQNDHYHIMGDLTVKGIVKCIEFDTKIEHSKHLFQAVSDTFKINRLDWGIDIYSKAKAENDESVIISDSIDFVVHVKAIR